MHVHVHKARRNTLPGSATCGLAWCVGDGPARACGVVPRPDRGGTRGEDCITSVRAEIEESIKRRVPSAIGPDVVENAIVENTVTATDGHLAFTLRVPSEADTGTEVMVLRLPHPAHWRRDRCLNAGSVMCPIAAIKVRKLRDNPMSFARRTVAIPPKPQIKRQLASCLPVILNKPRIIVRHVVAISVGLGAGGRINGGFLKVWIIGCKIRIGQLLGANVC